MKITSLLKNSFLFLIVFGLAAAVWPRAVQAATLSLDSAGGTYTVGSVFQVSIFLNTENQSVNAVKAVLNFPPSQLQLVSPSTGFSIINNWASQPIYSNQNGTIDLEGIVPNGVYADQGLIATLSFRVKTLGDALIKFTDASNVILNDGKGTNVLDNVANGIYHLILPPPGGPIVTSPTNPNQETWYDNPDVVLNWANDYSVQGYSYVLDNNPINTPDDIVDSQKTSVTYQHLGDGTYYFHIQALRNGVWGGVTNYAVNIDTTPPAEFPIEILPDSRTTRTQPIIQFATTDNSSGMDYYELKIVPLTVTNQTASSTNGNLFIETASPYVPSSPLTLGSYDVIVRAYDKAGNFREETKRLDITTEIFTLIQDQGLRIKNFIFLPWSWLWGTMAVLVIFLIYLAFFFRKRHLAVRHKHLRHELPHHIQEQLKELARYRAKYSKIIVLFLILGSLFLGRAAWAQTTVLTPPLMTTVSKNISNQDIFYAGGRTAAPDTDVILYIQNTETGETLSETVVSDNNGEWFYRHNTFLPSGNYILWAQTKLGDQLSPPSPQVPLHVVSGAIQFGASRLSLETIYLFGLIILLIVVLSLLGFIVFHAVNARRKRLVLLQETRAAEESVRRGFAVLRRDIQLELELFKKARKIRELTAEEKVQEAAVMEDLKAVENYLGKEIWDIEHGASA